jgi:DNA-directed RNA polymerase subunit RPC12/RpoP
MAKNQEINVASSQDRENKSAKYRKGLPTIRCMCGSRILIVPDLKAMNRAIKNHLAEHRQTNYGLGFDSLEEFLTEQILMAASKMNPPNVS